MHEKQPQRLFGADKNMKKESGDIPSPKFFFPSRKKIIPSS